MEKTVSISISAKIIIALSLFANTYSLLAQDFSAYQKKLYIASSDTLPYRILLPQNYNPNKAYPLVLFLHGMGERGNDNERQLIFGAQLFLNDSVLQKNHAVVVFPQCPEKYCWYNFETKIIENQEIIISSDTVIPNKVLELLKGLIFDLEKQYSLDKKRFYIGGLSMGGLGTFEMVHQNPDMFAAAFPICGGANPSIAKDVAKTSWWIFHGEMDDIVSVQFSKQIYTALQEVHADAKMSLYPNVKHNSWINALQEPELLPWLFSKKH